MLEPREIDEETRALAWERPGTSRLVGLLATMIGVFRPEERAEALVRGSARSAFAFALASFAPVAVCAFGFAHAIGAREGGAIASVAPGVVASLAGVAALVGSFSNMAEAYGARAREAARAALFLAWLVPLFVVDFGPPAAHAFGYSPERAEVFGAMSALLPLLLAIVGLEAAAKHGARIPPRVALVMGVVPAALAFAVGRVAIAAAGS